MVRPPEVASLVGTRPVPASHREGRVAQSCVRQHLKMDVDFLSIKRIHPFHQWYLPWVEPLKTQTTYTYSSKLEQLDDVSIRVASIVRVSIPGRAIPHQ